MTCAMPVRVLSVHLFGTKTRRACNFDEPLKLIQSRNRWFELSETTHSRLNGKVDVPAESIGLNAFGILHIVATLTAADPTFMAHGDSTLTGRNQVQVS
tara:strand:- start:69 stop:365 length:297 start_codon:yes stop_codon:yes gene_type:complete